MTARSLRTAVFPGTFNPFTVGHLDIVRRALNLFDRVVVAVGCNISKDTAAMVETSLESIRKAVGSLDGVEVTAYSGMTADLVRELGAVAVVRGVRTVADYEYERRMADANGMIEGVETVVLFARPELSVISSSLLRELAHYGRDISRFLPENQ